MTVKLPPGTGFSPVHLDRPSQPAEVGEKKTDALSTPVAKNSSPSPAAKGDSLKRAASIAGIGQFLSEQVASAIKGLPNVLPENLAGEVAKIVKKAGQFPENKNAEYLSTLAQESFLFLSRKTTDAAGNLPAVADKVKNGIESLAQVAPQELVGHVNQMVKDMAPLSESIRANLLSGLSKSSFLFLPR